MSLFKLLKILMRDNKKAIFLSLFISISTILGSVCLMALSAYIISFCALHPSIADISVAVVGVRFFGIGRAVSRYGERLLTHNTTFSLLSRLRVWLYTKIEKLPIGKYMVMDKGDVFTRMVEDVETLQEFFLRTFMPFGVAVFVGVIGTIGLAFFGTSEAVSFIIFYLITVSTLPIVVWYFTRGMYRRFLRGKTAVKTDLLDFINGLDELVGNSAVSRKKNEIIDKLNKNDEIARRLVFVRSVSNSLIMLLTNLAMAACMGSGIILVHSGKMNGVFLAVVTLTASSLFEAAMGIPIMLQKLEESTEAADRVFELEKEVKEPSISSVNEKLEMNNIDYIEAKHVSFGYENRNVLEDVCLKLEKKKHIALLGASGSGKTTLAYLMLNWLKPSSGYISIGGGKRKEDQDRDWMGIFSVVDQNIYFFNTTIKNNLLIGNPKASDEDLDRVLDMAQIKEFVDAAPLGLNTELGENGMKLSGGERQRLALARALLKDSPFMMFDEPTAGLDVKTEKLIFDTIHNCTKDKGVLVITHRLVNMDKYDEILVMKQGAIVERGTHTQLMNIGGSYSKMWEMQHNQLLG